ncbi:MAG TPA: protein kinase [Actinomycetota bacterium]
MDPRIGTVFAGHRIHRVIGSGGASVVYLAEHLRLGRRVALKVLAPHLADDEAFRERFIRESRIAAGLDHPNVVTVFDAGEVEGSLYISMRYVEGSDLRRILDEQGPLEPARAVGILGQIASALDAAHAEGLVHRDVKPANMLVEIRSATRDDRAYLSDFGITKRTASREGLTRTGQFVGTVDYVAPEQISGNPVDARTDVYSLGCVLFECLSGRVPFPGETGVATIYSHLNDAPPTLDPALGLGEGVDRIVSRALAKSKEARFGGCGELIATVRDELGARAATTELTGPPPADDGRAGETSGGGVRGSRVQERARSRRRALAISAVALLLLATVVALALVLPGGDDGTPADPTTTGPTTPPGGGEPPSFVWGDAYRTQRTGLLGATMIDALVDGGVVFAVGHGTSAVGEDDAAVWRSDDGRRWGRIAVTSLAEAGDQRMLAVASFEGTLVAAGWDGSDAGVWTSSDGGETWAASDDPDLVDVGDQRIRDLVPIGSELIAVGSSGTAGSQDAAAWSTSDGADWARMEASALSADGQQLMFAAQAVQEGVVAVGLTDERGDIDAAVWEYADGSWSRSNPEALAAAGQQVMLAIAGGGDELPLVAVGCEDADVRCDTGAATADAAVWRWDGASWVRVGAESGRLRGEGEETMHAIVTYRGSFVAVGGNGGPLGDLDGGVWTSADGVSWRASAQDAPAVTALGGAGDQELRALVAYSRHGVALFGFGVSTVDSVEEARVWGATQLEG